MATPSDAATPTTPTSASSIGTSGQDASARPPVTLTIAGSEATGGAGAQADLRTFQSLGTFGIVALTCIVSFDPKAGWGHRFVPVDPGVIADQLEAQLRDAKMECKRLGEELEEARAESEGRRFDDFNRECVLVEYAGTEGSVIGWVLIADLGAP